MEEKQTVYALRRLCRPVCAPAMMWPGELTDPTTYIYAKARVIRFPTWPCVPKVGDARNERGSGRGCVRDTVVIHRIRASRPGRIALTYYEWRALQATFRGRVPIHVHLQYRMAHSSLSLKSFGFPFDRYRRYRRKQNMQSSRMGKSYASCSFVANNRPRHSRLTSTVKLVG